MNRLYRNLALVVAIGAMLNGVAVARIHQTFKQTTIPTIQSLRVASENHQSNIEFWQQNFGELFFNTSVAGGTWGGFWPRGYTFHYIFGGGFWFGDVNNGSRHVLVGYNPYNGGSWFQPGSVDSAEAYYATYHNYPNESSGSYASNYPIYYSTDYNKISGLPLDVTKKLPPWPIWDTDPDTNNIVGQNHYFGNYVDIDSLRDTSIYKVKYLTKYAAHTDTFVINGHDSVVTIVDSTVVKKGGPAFVSDEDMFTVCNDMDTSYFIQSSNTGYPPIEVQRTIYSWGSTVNQNYIFVVYKIVNKSTQVLDSCWLAPVIDPDIGTPTNDENGYYNKDTTLNMALQWSQQEAGVPLASNQNSAYPGVLGVNFLQSPAIYKRGDLVNGQPVPDSLLDSPKPGVWPTSQQLGLVTFKRWELGTGVANDPTTDEGRYEYLSTRAKDTALNQYGDKRLLMATGPFKILPGQTAQVVMGLMIARDSANGDNDLQASINDCVNLDRRAQVVYDSNFRVPFPPDEPTIKRVSALSNGTFIQWDSASEFSFDPVSGGLDFLGYRLFRGRQDLIGTNGSTLYDQYKNPFGYKLIKQWSLQDLDSATFKMIEDSLPPDQAPAAVRQAFYKNYIFKYMDSLTNHHTYYDFGDLNHDGVVDTTELLINDVDYYYWLAAFDQGDPAGGIISQQTIGKVGQSKVRIHPVSSYAGTDSRFQILSTQGVLGGLSNFRWQVVNQQIIDELLAGDTMTVTFNHYLYDDPNSGYQRYGLNMRVQDPHASLDITYPYWKTGTPMPNVLAEPYTPNLYFFGGDTTTIKNIVTGVSNDNPTHLVKLSGLFESTDTAFAPNQYLLNAVEHLMNFNFFEVVEKIAIAESLKQTQSGAIDTVWSKPSQFVEQYHLDTSQVVGGDDTSYHTMVNMSRAFQVMQGGANVPIYYDNTGSFALDSAANVGQCDYLLQFTGSGVEQDSLPSKISGGAKKLLCNVPYLTCKITAEQIYHDSTASGQDSVAQIVYDLNSTTGNIQAGQWKMAPNMWELTPSNSGNAYGSRLSQYITGVPGSVVNKYYLTAHPVDPTLDTVSYIMVNGLHVGGNTIFLDSAKKGPYRQVTYFLGIDTNAPATQNFNVGDVVRISYRGGLLGLPSPGASFQTVFTQSVPQPDSSNVSMNELGNIHVWPNPYIIGNSVDPNAPGLQKPALTDRLVFNHLPPHCTIRIFNIVGDLIRTIDHTAGSEEYWDLLSDGQQKVGSQMLVAEVQTPNGLKQYLQIAVIVSGR